MSWGAFVCLYLWIVSLLSCFSYCFNIFRLSITSNSCYMHHGLLLYNQNAARIFNRNEHFQRFKGSIVFKIASKIQMVLVCASKIILWHSSKSSWTEWWSTKKKVKTKEINSLCIYKWFRMWNRQQQSNWSHNIYYRFLLIELMEKCCWNDLIMNISSFIPLYCCLTRFRIRQRLGCLEMPFTFDCVCVCVEIWIIIWILLFIWRSLTESITSFYSHLSIWHFILKIK